MNTFKLSVIMITTFITSISFDLLATKRSVKKASDALWAVTIDITDFATIDHLGIQIERIRSKFYKLNKSDWIEILHGKNNKHGKSLMEQINHFVIIADCGCHDERPGIPCSSDLCTMLRYAKFKFAHLIKYSF